MPGITFGPQIAASLDAGATREWLVTDGRGGYAMGTVCGLRTRRYHGLLVVATEPPIGRMLGLVALDPTIVVGDNRIPLATHEWRDGTIAPTGFERLAGFEWCDGVPKWRWVVGDIALEVELSMVHGRPAVGVVHRLVTAPREVTLQVDALCTWRDVHGERYGNGDPNVERTGDGFVFEDQYRVRGPNFDPAGATWWRGEHHREEAARGLNADDDVWRAGTFTATLEPGETFCVEAWHDHRERSVRSATEIVASTRLRTAEVVARAHVSNGDEEAMLVTAADQFVVRTASGPTVVAGYPWFGDWSRDTMTSYDGLFLCTDRWDDGRALLQRAATTLSEGMLANTADAGGLEYNTVDAAPWFLHAVVRHVAVARDLDLANDLRPAVHDILDHHLAGTRFGIRVDGDGLVTQGAQGWALTWMDARVRGEPVTPRTGKPVEVNALWVSGLTGTAALLKRLRDPRSVDFEKAAERARRSFRKRFKTDPTGGLLDVVDPDDASRRPNQLLATSLPHAPFNGANAARRIVEACGPLVTPLGLRSLDPADPRYRARHRGDPAERDNAYHQGTTWPWLIGPYVDARLRAELSVEGVVDGLLAHLREWGIGSVSETADGAPPHAGTGCPFQAWSVAETLRAATAARAVSE